MDYAERKKIETRLSMLEMRNIMIAGLERKYGPSVKIERKDYRSFWIIHEGKYYVMKLEQGA